MSVVRLRQFLLGLYHDLPNVLFVGSLVLGSITGYLPLVWVSMGLIMNAFAVGSLQQLFALLTDKDSPWDQIFTAKGAACDIIPGSKSGGDMSIIAPSYWLSSALFFASFVIYNSIQVAMMPVAEGASKEKADIRHAFTLTTIVIGSVFFLLVLLRGYSGCESYLGGALGAIIGIGLSIGFWHLLNVCGAGMVPDVLQVVNSMAPPGEDTVPVVCAA
jgi:hypothetical protein